MKKIKPIVRKILAWIGVVMVLVCSFVTPIAASGSTDDINSYMFYSYWNLAKIRVVYADTGEIVIYDMPQTFYETNSYYYENITLKSASSDRTLALNTYVGSTIIKKPSVAFLFDVKPFSSITLYFEDSVIRSYPLNFGNTTLPGYNTVETVPVLQLPTNDSSVISSFLGSYTAYRPMNGESSDDYTFKFGSESGSFGLVASSHEAVLNSGTLGTFNLFDLFPYSLYKSEMAYYANNISTNTRLQIPYYSSITADMNFNFSNVTSDTYRIGIALPLGLASNDVSFNSVSTWYDQYFTGYKQFGDGVNLDFTSWIATAAGGFLSFELIPGISFGVLLTFILGVAAVNFFLKFFAGG